MLESGVPVPEPRAGSDFGEHFEQETESNPFVVVVEVRHADEGLLVLEPRHSLTGFQLVFLVAS